MDLAAAVALFDDAAARYGDAFHRLVADRLVGGVDGAVAPRVVLDAATGTGDAAFAVLRRFRPERIVAIDLSPRMVERAVAAAAEHDPDGRIEWRTGPAAPAPVADAAVDLVVCASSLHFLGMGALRDWRRVLRPGGRVAFSLPAAATFRPAPAFADLVHADIPIPDDEDAAAAIATAAGFTRARAERLVAGDDRPRTGFLVHATAP
ncbi:class I SAM-dependent methyltransferase [Nocardiopsis sediminis]|uniref:Class I SAM-dependent methyltransferase n=1 Tax=Nocardiopsis sediminis TaxID=1778267 RepID=A0ABV8FNB9_9ACTN